MKKIVNILMLFVVSLTLVGCQNSNKNYSITPYVTKGDRSKLLLEETAFQTEVALESFVKVTVDSKKTYQTIDGFGAAMTESSAYLISQLDELTKENLMNDLFSTSGIGIDFIRIPMGASDFALSSYTYNDVDEPDVDMQYFSIARDELYIIPALKKALELNPDLKLMASPWSAPAWMKTSNRLNGGSLRGIYYEAYANYFVKFIEAYQAHGLEIYAITVQNEPLHETSQYPSMFMSLADQINFIKVLGERFKEKSIKTRIIGYDHNWDNQFYPQTLLDSPVIKAYLDGVAFHCYNGSVADQKAFYEKNSDANIWFTECTGISTYRNFSDNMTWNMENIFIGSINAGSKSALLWNLVLDENYGPKNGGCPNCVGLVEVKDGDYKLNEEYYAVGHFSKFINKDSKRIEVKSNNLNILSTGFVNQDGSIVVVLHNKSNTSLAIELNINGRKANYTIDQKTTVTLEINHV